MEDEDEGSWGNLLVNLYYALVNLGVMLGAMALIMVAYWLLKWATVSARRLPRRTARPRLAALPAALQKSAADGPPAAVACVVSPLSPRSLSRVPGHGQGGC